MVQYKHIIITLFLSFLPLVTVWGQVPHEFGTLSEGDIEWYKFEPEGDVAELWTCFTLEEPADVWLTLKKLNASSSGLFVFDSEENLIAIKDVDSSDNEIKAYVNLPAGNYQCFVDFAIQEYMELGIEVKASDLDLYEEKLGTFNESFADSYDLNVEDTYQFFHGKSYDGYGCCSFQLEKDMDIDIDLDGSTVSSSSLFLLGAHYAIVAQSMDLEGLTSLHLTNLKKGAYRVLFKSYDDSGSLIMNITGHAEVDIANDDTNTNHTIERTYTNADGNTWNDKVVYYDEMGREEEAMLKGYSPTGNHDLVSLTEYDEFGRVTKKWMPGAVENNKGAYIDINSLMTESKASNLGDSKPYTLTEYESSPLNRVASEYGTGADWQDKGKAMHTRYLVNDPNANELDCKRYSASGGISNVQLKCEGSYPKGSLTIKAVTDEDGQKSYEFKDGWGNVVLSRQEVDGTFADTYYIYDAWGHLQAVLPPMASNEMCLSGRSWSESDDVISSYAYLYAYDEQYRQIGVKLPGSDWKYSIYDQADTPVFTQDGEQCQRGEWSFTISDVWGRPCLEGICKNAIQVGTSLPNTSAVYSGASTNYGYTIKGITLTSPTVHKVTYYDNYDFLGNTTLKMEALSYANSQDADYNTLVEERSKGKETGRISAVDGQMEKAIKSVTYYDYRGRAIQTNSTNQLGGTDKLYMAYDFTDHITKQRQVHSVSGKSDFMTDLAYTYDHAGRLLTTTMSINKGTPTTISRMEYDELGRLVAENRNGNEKLRTTYGYNIRQWTKSIGGKLFNESLFYNESHNGATGLYNGNISAMDWSIGDNPSKTRGYGFGYDELERLTSANYYENGKKSDNYSTSYSYDLMGNIETLTRNGLLDDKNYGKMDDLTYEYNGNQVTKITDKVSGPYYKDAMHFVDGSDAEIEYEYDKNGCMTKDLNKNIRKIEYNLLNLPTKLSFEDGSIINYSYDADGNKLSADYNLSLMNVVKGTSSNNVHSGNSVTSHRDYCGNFIYEDGVLRMMLFNGGYVTFNGDYYNTPQYHFYLKDHLGNNRVVADANGNIEQVNHYYPFGGLMAESTGDVQPYKYNDKELDRMHGLDCYDYGARWMSDGRFTTQDPHAFDYTEVSPYAYCGNNPIKRSDMNGMDWYESEDGTAAFWQEGNEKTYNIDGVTYNNVGNSYSISYEWGVATFEQDKFVYDNPVWLETNGKFDNYLNCFGTNAYKTSVISSLINVGVNGKNDVFYFVDNFSKSYQLIKYGGWTTTAISAIYDVRNLTDSYVADNNSIGYNTVKKGADILATYFGSYYGAEYGAILGAKAGAAVGAYFGGVGAIPGALIGAGIGSAAGSYLLRNATSKAVNWNYEK